jgi:hypothetical protein
MVLLVVGMRGRGLSRHVPTISVIVNLMTVDKGRLRLIIVKASVMHLCFQIFYIFSPCIFKHTLYVHTLIPNPLTHCVELPFILEWCLPRVVN